MTTVDRAFEQLDAPDGVRFNFLEGTQEVEIVVECEQGELVMIEDVDPVYDQLTELVPEVWER